MSLKQVYAYISENLDSHIHNIQELVQIPSVSLEGVSLHECAEFVRTRLERLGCQETALVEVGDHYPGVWGFFDSGAPKTILYYSHYDVRPAGVEKWDWPPFGGELVEMAPYPRVVLGRGARASKGPLQAWLNALEAIVAVEGKLPVNILFLIEGAEILGSCNYLQLAEVYKSKLEKADALFAPGSSQNAKGEASVVLGYKGLIYIEVGASGERWGRGPTSASVHSATNAIVDNPAWHLVHALTSLTDRDGTQLTVPGLSEIFATKHEMSASDRKLLDALEERYAGMDPNTFIPGLAASAPVGVFKGDKSGMELLSQYLYGPSVNLSGLRSGYIGPGSKSFLLPNTAAATLDIRLITEMKAADILKYIEEYLAGQGFGDIHIHVFGAFDWGQTDLNADIVRATLQTLEKNHAPAVVWPMVAFGGPWAHLSRVLEIPALRGAGLGYGDRTATSNEFYVIEGDGRVPGLAEIERYFVDVLYSYAEM